jgi:hypothetical protein
MRKLLLTAAASAVMLGALFLSSGAEAMTPASASGVRAAAAATDLSESVAVVCQRPCLGCRKVCYRTGPYVAPYPYAYPYGYPGYYGPGVGIYGPGVGIGIGVGPRWGW